MEIKGAFLRNENSINKIAFDNTLHLTKHALGLHSRTSRIQGAKLKAKREILISSLFIETPLAFLRMIVVHELAHLKEPLHNKAFYQLCRAMEPDYAQLEFDLRCYLMDRGARVTA